MTSITLNVTGARIRAEVSGILTSGMVGIPVSIQYDEAWNGLTKNLVCRCSRWGPANSDTRTILNVGKTSVVAHEVMQPEHTLYLGIEGYSADGSLVMPTTWANCGYIHPGANTGADSSATPTRPIWAQLLAMIGNLAKLDTEAKENLVGAINEVAKTGNGSNVDLTGYVKSVNGVGPDGNGNVEITIPDSGGNVDQGGLTAAQIAALDGMFKIASFTSDPTAAYVAFMSAFGISGSGGGEVEPDEPDEPEKTLTSISATYIGGDVAVGTAVTALTGIVVTAHYSDGTSETVTGYTLSGSIAEGENTVTVSYGGKTTTFTVTGMAESGGDAVNLYSGQYLKSTNIDQHSENGNAFTYTPAQNGSSITYTIEGLEADKEYTIFVESTRIDGGAKYTQASVNTGSAASYDGKLVSLYPSWAGAGKNYATFTANGKTMYFWCTETGGSVAGQTVTLTVYIYPGTLTEKP